MFIDTSALIAILTREPEAVALRARMEAASTKVTSGVVILEAVMRLSTLLVIAPLEAEALVRKFLAAARIDPVAVDDVATRRAVEAFATYGKGRGHAAQLNIADCLSYGCARALDLPLLYKGDDFAKTALA